MLLSPGGKRFDALALLARLVLFGVLAAAAQGQTPLGTAFTYQGRLTDSSLPAQGNYDFVFTLFDAETGGNAVGAPVGKLFVATDSGVFNVDLDFGADAFDGNERWLQISVRPSGTASYVDLSPRQRISPTPYAIAGLDVLIGSTAGDRVQREFPVAAGETIAAGDVVSLSAGQLRKGFAPDDNEFSIGLKSTFSASGISALDVAPLDIRSFVIAYRDAANNSGKLVVGVDNVQLAGFSQPVTFIGTVGTVALASMTDDTVVIAYDDGAGGGYAMVARVAAGNVIFGSPAPFSSIVVSDLAVARLSDTRFMLAYRTVSGNGAARTGGIGGDGTITYTGLEAPMSAPNIGSFSIDGLDENRAAIGHNTFGGFMGGVFVGSTDISGNITFGDTLTFHSGDPLPLSVSADGPDSLAIFFHDGGATGNLVVLPATVSGTTIQAGTRGTLASGTANSLDTTNFFNGRFLTARDLTSEQQTGGSAIMVSLMDGSVRSVSSNVNYEFNESEPVKTTAISPTRFVIAYPDQTNGGAGVARMGEMATRSPIGIAQESGGEGSELIVAIGGVSSAHAGLEVDGFYYAQPDGSLSQTPTDFPAGQAISETEILMVGGLLLPPR